MSALKGEGCHGKADVVREVSGYTNFTASKCGHDGKGSIIPEFCRFHLWMAPFSKA